MQTDAYQEFLQANSRRNYPFVEDASLWDDGGSFEIQADVLLNFRGFSRQEPEDVQTPVQLAALVGPTAPTMPGPFEADPVGWVMVFRLGTKNQETGAPQYLRVVVDLDIPSDPLLLDTLTGFVPSAFGQLQPVGDMTNHGLTRNPTSGTADNYDYLAAMIHVSVSPDVLDSMPGNGSLRLYFSEALIEPSLFINTWRTEIERLVVEDQCWPEADVRGAVTFKEGYNMEVVRLDNSIMISPERRAGKGVQPATEFVEWLCGEGGSSSGNSLSSGQDLLESLRAPCRGNILRVNGVGPDENYSFRIFGGNGVTIQNFPNEHLIVINAAIPQPTAICPPDEQVVGSILDGNGQSVLDSNGNPVIGG